MDITADDMDCFNACRKFTDWYTQKAVPLWSRCAYDAKRGGFFEALDFAGAPIIGRARRVRVQCRQIYAFPQSALHGWGDECEAIAAKGFDDFIENACPQDGRRGCAHLISDDGDILDDQRDLYDQAFLLLACSARWRAVKDARAKALADNTITFIDRELAASAGGWFDSDRAQTPRRQNPHMHLFEAFLALHETTSEQRYFDYAAQIYKMFEDFFYNAETGFLVEFFDADLSPLDGPKGVQIEPGHMMEWVWLLDRYAKAGGKTAGPVASRLYAKALAVGRDQAGYLVDRVDITAPSASGARRLWPQTEFLKAAIILAQAGVASAQSDAAGLINRLFADYLNEKVTGLWCDQFDAAGARAASDVPASILYHLYDAAALADKYANEAETK